MGEHFNSNNPGFINVPGRVLVQTVTADHCILCGQAVDEYTSVCAHSLCGAYACAAVGAVCYLCRQDSARVYAVLRGHVERVFCNSVNSERRN